MLTLFNPGDLQSLHFLKRQGPNVWSYYGLAWAGETRASRGAGSLLCQSRQSVL